MRLFALSLISVLLASSWSAKADDLETKSLFQKGSWSVELTHDTSDGTLWCSADTQNRAGQLFSIVAYDNEMLILFLYDSGWDIAEREIRFLIDVDYSRWKMQGKGRGPGISMAMSNSKSAAEFLKQLMDGNAVAVMNTDERRLAVFSLSGSFAAISNLFACWSSIVKEDPFSGSDPFLSGSDPF